MVARAGKTTACLPPFRWTAWATFVRGCKFRKEIYRVAKIEFVAEVVSLFRLVLGIAFLSAFMISVAAETSIWCVCIDLLVVRQCRRVAFHLDSQNYWPCSRLSLHFKVAVSVTFLALWPNEWPPGCWLDIFRVLLSIIRTVHSCHCVT